MRHRQTRVLGVSFSHVRAWQYLVAIGGSLYLCSAIAFLLYGRLNADEGWYIYASRMVYDGYIPYRDFAFTQMPLLPYVYGDVCQTTIRCGHWRQLEIPMP